MPSTTNCSFCGFHGENIDHLFVECSYTKLLWQALSNHFSPALIFPPLNSQSVHLGFLDDKIDNFLLLNHILLIFKIYIYNSRAAKKLPFAGLLARIEKIFNLESRSQEYRANAIYDDKWRCIAPVLSRNDGLI